MYTVVGFFFIHKQSPESDQFFFYLKMLYFTGLTFLLPNAEEQVNHKTKTATGFGDMMVSDPSAGLPVLLVSPRRWHPSKVRTWPNVSPRPPCYAPRDRGLCSFGARGSPQPHASHTRGLLSRGGGGIIGPCAHVGECSRDQLSPHILDRCWLSGSDTHTERTGRGGLWGRDGGPVANRLGDPSFRLLPFLYDHRGSFAYVGENEVVAGPSPRTLSGAQRPGEGPSIRGPKGIEGVVFDGDHTLPTHEDPELLNKIRLRSWPAFQPGPFQTAPGKPPQSVV